MSAKIPKKTSSQQASFLQHAMASLLFFVLLVPLLCTSAASKTCRCLPTEACWPNARIWSDFNSSIDGVLVQVRPVAAVCHDPYYDEEACRMVSQKFNDPFWRASQPGALQGPNLEMDGDKGCLLGETKSASCYQGALPLYAVSAQKPSHVQSAVLFAAEHNLRLVIKNSGHELTGRNTAAGSLSIWMHHLKEITFLESFQPTGCTNQPPLPFVPFMHCHKTSKSTSAFKVGAGVLWEDLYHAANETGKTVVGAQCTSVGASGGFAQGAGHSQLSPTFGLAADNVLELEVVTADGRLLVANSCQNQELFWALRGGGGGTFGVVVSATHTAHPALSNLVFASYIITAPNSTSTSFQNLLSHFIGLNPSLSDSGWGGFFILGSQTLIIQYLLPNRRLHFARNSFQPLLSYIEKEQQELKIVNGNMQLFTSYYEWHRAIQCPGDKCGYPSGYAVFEASRLIPREVVDKSPAQLAETLLKIQSLGYQRVSGYLVAGGKVSQLQYNAVNPAWRKALLHVLFVKPFAPNATMDAKLSMGKDLTSTAQMLRDMTPESGAYLNEADPDEPNWTASFFGSNYEALKAIKNKVDPKGLFICRHCVGSEEWSEDLNCRK